MKLNRSDFLKILSILRPGLSKKTIIEQSTRFIFTKEKLITFNGEVCVMYPFETDFACSIPSDELFKVLTDSKDKIINFTYSKKKKFILKTKKTKLTLNTDILDDLSKKIDSLIDVKIKWLNLPDNFNDGIKLCSISTLSKNIGEDIVSCVNINGNVMVSTDNLRISEFKLSKKIKKEISLPISSALELTKFNIKKYFISDSWAYFLIDETNAIICTRLLNLNGSYPDTKSFFELDGIDIEFPDELIQSINRTSIFADGDFDSERMINVSISKGKIVCKAEKDIGAIEDITKTDYSGKDIAFIINPIFFSKILSKTNKMKIGDNKALFEIDGFRHLILLLDSED